MDIINMENITKVFGKGDSRVEALRGISLKIEEGDMLAIVGASGSGKSTLLNILGTLDNATDGSYLLEDKNVSNLSVKELAKLRNSTFGFVVQHFALIKNFSAYENVEVPLEYSRKERKKFQDKIYNILKKLGLEKKIYKKPTELSGGQCQRVAIARALVNDAKIILADEPTGALDKQTGQEVMEIFKELNKEGKTIIIVTHDENVANQCNRIIRMEDGLIAG